FATTGLSRIEGSSRLRDRKRLGREVAGRKDFATFHRAVEDWRIGHSGSGLHGEECRKERNEHRGHRSWLVVESISSTVFTTRLFISYARWAVIRAVISATELTLEASRKP